jgi:hypothetical protein
MMQHSLAEFAALREGAVVPGGGSEAQRPAKAVAAPEKAGRAAHEPGKMNGLEKRYAAHLELRRTVGEIRHWAFEPLKLKLASATFYNVDFLVVLNDGTVELHETKGHWEDDARVKIKVAAKMFPWWAFVGVQWVKEAKTWKFERFKA